ncbi:formate dehydrogenase subunit delta [Marinobacterium arenosum]|uniref:formate dehydrogenase subunit delta n=1 Tax=Marinobacterium arenosum TaxID=2862496 RepID=UPI001C94C75D|nr:formate dehydrogenase subunit delta [Marinobacterium arenosum]MBY4675434.1 formate dehydrogenase subunit delta [Marinobacterium arenosum]
MSHPSQQDHLVRMINQIAANNLHHDDVESAATMVAGHIRKFWARPMKQQISAYLQQGGDQLSPVARRAVELVGEASV